MRSSHFSSIIIATVIAAASLAQAESTESMITCTPGSDPDWTTQGNNYARTNSTTASISNLCGLQVAWSHEFPGDVQTIQPIITGDKILVTSTDSLHCFDRVSGAVLWSFGGFPYIVGDLRGSPTVDGGFVYVGGAGAQAFSKVDLATGAVVWSRNLGGVDVPLAPGQTNGTPSIVAGGAVYFTQETGNVYKLDVATGADLAGSPLALPDAPAAVPYNALTSDGTKLWVGTADAVGTAGNIHQIDMATMNLDWTLNNPGIKFWGPGDVGTFEPFNPEGFPGSMAYEGGILYYHSQIRNDANGFLHFPGTGSVGAIDVATEDGTGAGILWVQDAQTITVASPGRDPAGSYNFSGPAIGPDMVYLTSRGIFGPGLEQHGVSAWDKTLGTRVWYRGYDTPTGQAKGMETFIDVRSDAPASVFCQADGTPYVFTGHLGGQWRLSDGNTGEVLWHRTMTERVRGTAVADDCVVTVTRRGPNRRDGGAVMVFVVGPDRPRLQVDAQFVSQTISEGEGTQTNTVPNAISNSGCVDLHISGYNATAASDPLFLTAVSGPATLAPGESGAITITYDETGLSPYFNYTNYIEIVSDDPDYYPQDPGGVALGDPVIEVNLVVGCWEDSVSISLDSGAEWINNYGSLARPVISGLEHDSDDDECGPRFIYEGFHINDKRYHHVGSMWIAAQDSLHWAIEGMSKLSSSPCFNRWINEPREFAPGEPCGLTLTTNSAPTPMGGTDEYGQAEYRIIDAASELGYFTPGSRQCFGVILEIQRIGALDAAFGDFGLVRVNLINEADGQGDISDLYFGVAQDWDMSGHDNTNLNLTDGSYSCDNGAEGGRAAATAACGNTRLDAPAVGTAAMESRWGNYSGDHMNDFYADSAAFVIASDPYNYIEDTYGSGTVVQNTDVGVYMSIAHMPFLAEDSSAEFYYCTWQLDNGINGLPWSDSTSYDAAVTEIVCRAKAYAGFGKGDINCDGAVDLADVVLLGNIVDGLTAPVGGGIYTADVDADLDYDEADYDLLFDVVGGVQPASAMGNAWRF